MSPAGPQEKTAPLPETRSTDDQGVAAKAGRFAYRHRDFMNGNVGWFGVKQVAASFVASFNMMLTAIPTVFTLEWLHDVAKRNEAKGEAGMVGRLWADEQVYKPLRAIAFVASGFTMYRGTRKILNKLFDKVFNPENDEKKTIEEVRNLPHSLHRVVVDIMPAEAQSTPFGAIALGGIRTLYQGPKEDMFVAGKAGSSIRTALIHPQSRFAQQAIIDTLGYSAFFELSDRLYKDIQLRRHQWNGEPNSIATIKHSAMDDKAPAGDDDPSIKRLFFQRALPTAMGITAYTVTHRASKQWTGASVAPVVADLEKKGELARKFFHNFKAEWAAIGTFFIHSAIAEKYEKAYDHLLSKINSRFERKETARA